MPDSSHTPHGNTPQVHTEELRERIALALYKDGAYCGTCSYEGWETCADCRHCVRGYADAALAILDLPARDARIRAEALAPIVALCDDHEATCGTHYAPGLRWAACALSDRFRALLVASSASIEDLIEASSLGTPEARALRESVSPEDAQRVVERANDLSKTEDPSGEVTE